MEKMTKKVLVVPDVHGRLFWKGPVERYLEEVDRVVFLGDYLDPYADEDEVAGDIFENLQEIVTLKEKHPEKVVLLKGNHDQHYASELFRDEAGGTRMDYENWERYHQAFAEWKELFQIAHMEVVGGVTYVFSHAGMTLYWLKKVNDHVWQLPAHDVSLADPAIVERVNRLDDDGQGQEMLATVGTYRSWFGEKTGSVLWADIREHAVPDTPKAYGLDKVFQVFGHTKLNGRQTDMVATDHLAMIDSQQCFMIDESLKERIVPLRDEDMS